MSLLVGGDIGVSFLHLTTGPPVQSSTKLGYEMSLHRGLGQEGCGGWEGLGGECGVGCVGVHWSKGHPAQSSTKLGNEMSLHRDVGGRRGCRMCGDLG